jgi:predicted SprT family Zn-dependent metalloprotease
MSVLNVKLLLILVVIALCASYAYSRESVRNTDLQDAYQDLNVKSFHGALPKAQVSWGYLDGDFGETNSYEDGSFRILIDRTSVTSQSQLLGTLKHEACHVKTMNRLNGEDAHGEMFQACMSETK